MDGLVLIGNYVVPTHSNDINKINDHKNNNNFTAYVPHFSTQYIGLNVMTCDNNNNTIEIVSTID